VDNPETINGKREMVEEINLAPTDEGYRNIAYRFLGEILGDVPRRRAAADRQILGSLLEIVAYLAQKDPKLAKELIDSLK
jgi:hypothetical protein